MMKQCTLSMACGVLHDVAYLAVCCPGPAAGCLGSELSERLLLLRALMLAGAGTDAGGKMYDCGANGA